MRLCSIKGPGKLLWLGFLRHLRKIQAEDGSGGAFGVL